MAKTVQAHGIEIYAKLVKLDGDGGQSDLRVRYGFTVSLVESMANGYVWLTPEGKAAVTEFEALLDAALVDETGSAELDTKVALPEETEQEHATREAIEAAIEAGETAKGMTDEELEQQAASEKRRRAARKAAATRKANKARQVSIPGGGSVTLGQ